jgi:hypothetical protein
MRGVVLPSLIFAVFLLGCAPDGPSAPPRTTARAGGDVDGSDQGSPVFSSIPSSSSIRPRISIDPEDIVLEVSEANLDLDADLEQVIAVKNADGADEPVRVIIADSDSSRGRYYFASWESPTGATSSHVFSMMLSDLIGDHGVEIVVQGMDSKGLLTLDVFAKDAPSQIQSLSFHSICQVTANDIRIEEIERGDKYAKEQKNGESFSIITCFPDQGSKNVLDTIQVTYNWKYGENKYVAESPVKIAGEQVDQQRLEELYTSSGVASFEKYIEGAWVSFGPGGSSTVQNPLELIDFEPGARRISRFMGDTEEIYVWNGSYRILASRMDMITRSEPVPTILRTFKITATTVNTLEIDIEESGLGEVSSGTFERLSEETERKFFFHGTKASNPPSMPRGKYSNLKGLSVSFGDYRAAWKEDGVEREGVFFVFSMGADKILTVRFKGETRNYLMVTSEKRKGNLVTRNMLLTPVQLTVDGYEESGDALSLDQVENVPSP